MICPVIHPEPCPDPEACQAGYPCSTVLAVAEGKEENERFINNVRFVDKVTLHSYGPILYPLPVMEGQFEIVPTPDKEL